MTPPSTILASERDRASMIAMGTLCVLAVVQMGLALKLLSAPPTPTPTEGSRPTMAAVPSVVPEIGQISTPPSSSAPPLPGSSMPMPSAAAPVSNAPPPIGSFSKPGSAAPMPAPTYVPPAPTAAVAPLVPAATTAPMPAASQSFTPPSAPGLTAAGFATTAPTGPNSKPDAATALLRDVNYVVSAAQELRGLSDMQGTLELLRKADELTPDHPAIIAEMAQTYEQMGITAKATDAWRRIQLLGATKAGSYFELASRRLGSGSAAVAAPASAASGSDGEKFLRLGACHAVRDFSVNTGERYVLRVPISRAGNRPINSQELNLEVFFFDRVNNEKVALTIAPEPVESWQSAPVDWNGTGEEVLDVVYHLPALSAAEIQQHGRRSYYGYMLRLYYNNKLQDVAAEPRDLLEFGSTPGAASGGMNPLLPPMGR